MFSEQEVR